jgi:hypothetical protein
MLPRLPNLKPNPRQDLNAWSHWHCLGHSQSGTTEACLPALLYVHVVAVQVHKHVGVLHLALYQLHSLRCRVEQVRLVPAEATSVQDDTSTSCAVLSAFDQFQ